MTDPDVEYLTTREVAELLRIKERKVYDLAASGDIPCSRAMGKLLFPKRALTAWLAAKSSGPIARSESRPSILLGSHDPLLEWAVRESRSDLATFLDGSLDGIERFSRREGCASGLHLYDPAREEWNEPLVRARFAEAPVVLIEWAWRERGLIVPPESVPRTTGIKDLKGRRLVPRQPEAGSQKLLEHLLEREALDPLELALTTPARSETEVAVAVLEGRADAAFGLLALARQYRLGFVPVARERFDLLVDRWSWFEPALQTLLLFCRSAAFHEKARELGGYDVGGLGHVRYNGAR
jgi:excisionase family DNA binding protein